MHDKETNVTVIEQSSTTMCQGHALQQVRRIYCPDLQVVLTVRQTQRHVLYPAP